MIKLSDYVIDCIAKLGVEYVFMVSGGGGMHLINSLGHRKDINYICNHHEQAAVMSAEGYQRVTNGIGVALVTTGPAATNTLTGVLCAWNDSIPMIIISGQANSNSLIGDTGLRQRGVHEVDIESMVKNVTKYAITIRDENTIKYHMEKAVYLALNGRPGPVWIDIPINIQAKMIDVDKQIGFEVKNYEEKNNKQLNKKFDEIRELLSNSQRPIILAGHGIKLSHAEENFLKFIEKYRIPVVTSKNALELIDDKNDLLAGRIGINGQRAGNFAIQNSDLVISIGCRLAYPTVGYNTELFAREAKKIVIDIDNNQIEHSNINIDIAFNMDAKKFINILSEEINDLNFDFKEWINQCIYWRKRYPVILEELKIKDRYVNPYNFFEVLSNKMDKNDTIITDQGAAFYCFTVAFKIKQGQSAFTNGGFSPMGYGLPAAIGACCAKKSGKTICVHGDGGLQMNIQELQTIVHNKFPIKLFVFDNEGYLSIKHTQTNYFNGYFVGCDPKSGVSCPNILKISDAYGIKSFSIENQSNMEKIITQALEWDGPVIINVKLNPMERFEPKVVSVKKSNGDMISKPLEDMSPLLDREELKKEMIIPIINE
ncbi:thiamine pyrophosphate-binding protein [Clostridium botulinum]|uniref:thiamine pyrophosphate-binding protein n=1 Tax=Clostridium botulinum TaxID=1491 RepID=UPI00196784E3|nr:thiamine pyrophosphate-binding protein [Clostridium botulinum]